MLNQDNRAVYDGKVCTVGADEQMPQAAASKTSGTDKHQLAKDVYAQMLVSECYMFGEGVAQDVAEAAKFYKKVADLRERPGSLEPLTRQIRYQQAMCSLAAWGESWCSTEMPQV